MALHSNKTWAEQTSTTKPDLFPTLAAGQKPEILWLGCSDSRCPETTILGLQPGDVFVHRNIANVVHASDLSALSVIAYAVGALKVQHVVVCGHTSCGGAAAALGNQSLGILDTWLMPLKQLRAQHAKAWEGLDDQHKALKLVEANVRAGVRTVKENPIVIHAMKERGLDVHGLIYNVGTGHLEEVKIEEAEEEKRVREAAFETK
ncbi:MAG: hypothetical protein Q9163_005367 [Psora crenata]